MFAYDGEAEFDFGHIVRTVGSPATGWGNDGPMIIDTINPRYTITEFGDLLQSNPVDKIGKTSGWTTGTVKATCVHHEKDWSEYEGEWHDAKFLCQDEAWFWADTGDSGAPVFRRLGNENVRIAGIFHGRDTVNEFSIYSPASGLQEDFGTFYTVEGSLNPLSVSISGPTEVPPDVVCRWEADVSGGSPSYTYAWSGVLSGNEWYLEGSLSSGGNLSLTVTDGEDDSDGDLISITVDEELEDVEGCEA